jgi:hypothetical protein
VQGHLQQMSEKPPCDAFRFYIEKGWVHELAKGDVAIMDKVYRLNPRSG